jgi:hypothetical protein
MMVGYFFEEKESHLVCPLDPFELIRKKQIEPAQTKNEPRVSLDDQT